MATTTPTTTTSAFNIPFSLIPISSSTSAHPKHSLRYHPPFSISSTPLCLRRSSACSSMEISPAKGFCSAGRGRDWFPVVPPREDSRVVVHRVLPAMLSNNAAFYSTLTNQQCCFSSSDKSSSVYQPRPAVILPGLGNNSGDYLKLQAVLEGYGIKSVVANVSRLDWLRNAAGLLDLNYWKGTLRPRPVLEWYLKRVDAAVQEAKELVPGKSLSLVGHSAGGWLARVYMQEFGASDISLLLTLGTPHTPPPKGVSGVIDQTRGLLDYVHKHCAKAVYTPELKYVCVAGRYIQGARLFNESFEDTQYAPSNNDQQVAGVATMAETTMSTSTTTTFRARFVGQGYKQVCGRADVWGDGVVPEESAYLEGALNIGLDGVYHSPVGSDNELRPWYGSPAVVEQWINHLLDE